MMMLDVNGCTFDAYLLPPGSPNCSEGALGRGQGAREGQRERREWEGGQVVGRAGHASLINIHGQYYFFTGSPANNTTPPPRWPGLGAVHK